MIGPKEKFKIVAVVFIENEVLEVTAMNKEYAGIVVSVLLPYSGCYSANTSKDLMEYKKFYPWHTIKRIEYQS